MTVPLFAQHFFGYNILTEHLVLDLLAQLPANVPKSRWPNALPGLWMLSEVTHKPFALETLSKKDFSVQQQVGSSILTANSFELLMRLPGLLYNPRIILSEEPHRKAVFPSFKVPWLLFCDTLFPA